MAEEGNYGEDYEDVGQQGIQPSISDPKLWLIKCRLGKERESVANLYHKFFSCKDSSKKIKILSAASFDSLKGYIYIEAYKEANVREAISDITALRENSIKIVPLTEMTAVFNYDKIVKIDLKPKQWVRMKTGLYEGDLAQVVAIEDPINKIYVRMVPRLTEQVAQKEKNKSSIGDYNKKLKKNLKPLQRLFNPKNYYDVETKNHPILRDKVYCYNRNTFKDGFLIKSVRAKGLLTEDVVPTIQELRIFESSKHSKEEDGGTMDFDTLINTIQDTEIYKKNTFNKGDRIRITKGNLIGITGKVVSQDNGLVSFTADVEGINDILEISEKYVSKRFMPGDLIRVISGNHLGKHGLIMKIEEDTAYVFSESLNSQFKVATHDIIQSSQHINETDYNSYYQLGDLVKINLTNQICYVLDIQKHSLKLIDTRSEIKSISTKDITKETRMYKLS